MFESAVFSKEHFAVEHLSMPSLSSCLLSSDWIKAEGQLIVAYRIYSLLSIHESIVVWVE